MSGRRSKKNQRLGSSRRGPKGLNRNIEKDDDDGFQQIAESEDGQNEYHTSTDYHSTQFDHPPSSSIDQQTSALECPPHASGHKDSLMETELRERKRKMGSTRKSTGRFKVERKLDEVRTTEELDEEYVTQPNTSTTEEQHASLTEEQSRSVSFPSDLSLQTKSSGLGKEPGTTLMFAVSKNDEKDAIYHQEITSHSHEVVSDMPIDEAMGPSVHSIAVTVAESDFLREDSVMFDEPKTLSHQEIPIASTSGQKRRMGSTRRLLGGKNSENVGVKEHSRNMTENERKAEVMGEAKFNMLEEMAQTWDDVARDDPSSHTESALVLNQSLLVERAELKEPDVSAGTETMNQSVAFPLVDSEKPLPKTSSHHGTPLLNEGLDFTFGSNTADFDALNKVLKEAGSHLSDNSAHVPETRKDTNTSCDLNTEAKEEVLKQKEELSTNDQMSSLLPKQDAQLEELALNDQEYSLSQHDIANLDNNCDCSMAQLIGGGSRSFDVPVSNISHAEPTAANLPHEMSDNVEQMQETHMEMKQENNVCDFASVTCDTLTDLECIREEDEDPQILAMRENEKMSDERGSETDNAFEMTDQGDVRDHNVTQIIMDVRDNEKDGDTSTETICISHQNPCDVSAEKEELYREQEQYSSNESQTHSPTQDDAEKMLENDEVRKNKKETENASVNDVTSKSEEMFSFEDSATDTGSHTHQQLFMQYPDKKSYDLHENENEQSEMEGILFSVESENEAFDRGDGRSEVIEGIMEMDAVPVLILDVDTVYNDSESENPEQNRVLTEEQTATHLQVLQISDNVSTMIDSGLLSHDVVVSSGETETVPEESDISSFIPEDSQDHYKPTTFHPESQEKTGDAERVAVGGDTDLQLEIEAQSKTFDSVTSETKDAHIEALKVSENAEKEVSGESDTISEQSATTIIPEDSHGEEAHSKSSPVIHKRKMGSTRRPLKGKKGQRKEIEHHDENETLECESMISVEKETFSLGDEPSTDESTLQRSKDEAKGHEMGICSSDLASEESTAISICHVTESQTLTKLHAGSQENTGDVEMAPAEGDTEPHLENKIFDSTAFEGKATEENICEASVLVKEVEFVEDTVTVESNMTTESSLIQNDTSSNAKLEALNVSDNAEHEVLEETDTIPKQSNTTIIPEDTQIEEARSKFTVIHKRKMGSTRRPLKGNKGQRKEIEHHDENETLDSEGMINVEKETISLEDEPSLPDLASEESTAITICHITESQTLTKIHEVSQENAGDIERVPAEEDLQLKTDSQNKTFDLITTEAEGTEENIENVSVTVVKEVEVIGDTVTVESNMTSESDFLHTSPDANIEALKGSENTENEVSGGTDTILKQSDISIIPEDSHREETQSKSSPVVHKRKMGSTRRPLKGNKGQDYDEKEILNLEDEPSPDESRYSAVSICDISESQTLTKIHARSQENTGDVEIMPAEGDTEPHLENKMFDSTAFEGEATEENICEASVLVKEVEFIEDTVIVESNMTTESDLIQNDTSSNAELDALKASDNAEREVLEETDAIPKQSDTTIIPEDTQREEAHSKFTVIHKRKMGSTRRTLRGNKGHRKEKEHHDENETHGDEKEIFILDEDDEPRPDEPRYTAVSDISESQTFTKVHAESQEDYEDVERALVERDTEPHSEVQTEITTLNSATFEEGTEETICEASVVVKEIEFIGDTVTVESNMTIKSDLLQNYTSSDAKPEALISEIAENKVSGKTDTVPKQSDTNIIPEVPHGEEVHTKLSLTVHKRKMGSTRRPLRGNKDGQRKVRVESKEKNGDSEGFSEEENTETHSEIQKRDNVVDHNVKQEIMNIRDHEDEERKTMKTVDMSNLELEQKSDASHTQTGSSQDDTGSHLLEVPEGTTDFARNSFACRSPSDLALSDALLIEETPIHVSSEDVPPTEMVEIHPVSTRSMPKRKMGSTRKRGKRMVNEEEVEEEKEGEAENTTIDDGTTKSEENLTIEEAITGSPVHQQMFSSSADKEGHEIQDIVCKLDVQTEISEQNDPNSTINPEPLIESECSSNVAAEMLSHLPLRDVDTYLGLKQSVIPEESHREDQPNLNPVVQKRKMGSTRKTLRGNKGQGREGKSKKMDRDNEEMPQQQDTEPHLTTIERRTECKFDEEVEQKFPVEFSHPGASSNMFSESGNGVKEVSLNIHDLSEVSEENGMENTGNYSNSLNEAINLYEGTKDKFVLTVSHEDVHQTVSADCLDQHAYGGSEPEQTENTCHVIPTQELKNTLDDVVHENNSRKILATQEKRRKMGSTRRNPQVTHGKNMADDEDILGVAEDRETKKADDDLDDMPLASSISQSKEVSSVSTTDLESEMLVSATDLKVENEQLHSSEPSGPTVPEKPESTLQMCDNQVVNADDTKHPQSEAVTIEKRRKMGSTRKNFREGRIRGKRDGYENTETADTNVQISQDCEMSLVREDVGEQTTHDYSNQSEDSLLCEIEKVLNKTSQSSLNCDWELIVKEPNSGDLANAPDLDMPENSEIKSLQPTPSAHSEPNSPGRRRRKMGSTRKNPRQQLKAEREDEDKEDGDENLQTNKQENNDLERVEVSIVHNITENKLNKEYLDVSSAHTSSSQQEESTNPVSQERTSPSTKRKFGSRRANKGKQGLGMLAASDFGNELEDGDHKPDSSEVEDKLCSDDLRVCDPRLTLQPENHPVSEQRNMEAKNEETAGTGAGLVSLGQIIKHDRSTGAKQTVNLKNRNAEVVQFNVVMVGNSCVGKTSFVRRFHEGQFTEDYRSTIGVDTCIHTIALPDRTVKLQIWDTAGQERFHSITTQVFHKADGLLLMYEITCSKSFISVRDWISQARERAPDDVIMMLLGNKNDSVEREVQIQEGVDLAREYDINFMECSAATGANVSESMRTLAELLVQRKSQKEKHTTLRREPPQKKSGCC